MNAPGPPDKRLHGRWLAAALVAVLLTRAPFLLMGYGSDEDSWRVAQVARDLQVTGQYHVSRFPGYPLHELVCTPLVALGGSVATNAATLGVALACVTAFHVLLRRRMQHAGGLVLLFALAPLFWLSSSATLDHPWSLLFQLLGLEALLRRSYASAGIFAGAAVGFRPSDAVVAIPILVLLLLRREPLPRWAVFGLMFLATVALAFLPVLSTYGLPAWVAGTMEQASRAAEGQLLDPPAFAYRSVYAIGPLAALCLTVAAVFGWQRTRASLREKDELTIIATVGLLSVLLAFALFPIERTYLLSGLPFLLILLGRAASPRLLAATGVCLVSFAIVNPDVVRHQGTRGSPGMNLRLGMVLEDWGFRQQMLAWRTAVARRDYPPRVAVMTGAGPSLWLENPELLPVPSPSWFTGDDTVVRSQRDSTVFFLPVLSLTELDRTRAAGYAVVALARNQAYIEAVAGYSLEGAGIPVLTLP